jgi:hypothetical protein
MFLAAPATVIGWGIGRGMAAVGSSAAVGAATTGALAVGLWTPVRNLITYSGNIFTQTEIADIGTIIRDLWTYPEFAEYYKNRAKMRGYDASNLADIIMSSERWPTVEEILRLYMLGWLTEEKKIRWKCFDGKDRDYSVDDFLRAAQVPYEKQHIFKALAETHWPLETAVRLARRYGQYPVEDEKTPIEKRAMVPETGPWVDSVDRALRQEGLGRFPREAAFQAFQQYPSLQDVIVMAVREVFTPALAEELGLFHELPEPFLQEARRIGLSAEHAKWYWGAHWRLPSAEMGFEMFHRGIISRDRLKHLLRALDFTDVWREDLIQLAYNPITRVDIRRLYQQGVIPRLAGKEPALTDPLVRRYLAIGYSPDDAKSLALFTERAYPNPEIQASLKTLTTTYEKGYLDDKEFEKGIKELRLPETSEDFILKSAKIKRDQKLLDVTIKKLLAQLADEEITEEDARKKLKEFDLSDDSIDRIIALAEVTAKPRAQDLSDTEAIRLYKRGVLTDRAEVVKLVAKAGRSKRAAEALVKEAELLIQTGAEAVSMEDMIGWYVKMRIDEDRLTAYLAIRGYPKWAREEVLRSHPRGVTT